MSVPFSSILHTVPCIRSASVAMTGSGCSIINSHWEQRVFTSELMAPASSEHLIDTYVSRVSLSTEIKRRDDDCQSRGFASEDGMIVGVVFVVGRSTPTTSPNTGIHGRAGAETEKIKSTLRRHMADSRQAVILERAVSLLNYLYMFQSPDSVQHARANAQMLPQREREREITTDCLPFREAVSPI